MDNHHFIPLDPNRSGIDKWSYVVLNMNANEFPHCSVGEAPLEIYRATISDGKDEL
jgi:hypothetical protein